MQLSIVICSYDRYALLQESVRAVLQSKSFDPQTMELIVVDNTPPSKRVIPLLGDGGRVVPCDEPGLSRARNAGIDVARGSIVAFVDDDAFVSNTWCANVVEAFDRYPGTLICGGRTTPRFVSSDRPVWYYPELVHHLSCIDWGKEARPIRRGEWIVGANMAFRSSVFEDGIRFDPSLGRKGTVSLLSNDEIALIEAIGLENVYYIPEMTAEHLIPPERLTAAWFRKRVFWQAVSDVLSESLYKTTSQAFAELKDVVARAPAEYRGHNLLHHEPRTAQELRDQLSAVYLHGMLLAEGFSVGADGG